MSELATQKPRRRKWLRRIGWSLLILLVALLAVRLAAGAVMQHRLDAKLAELRKAGEPVTMAEMALPNVPEGENAAVSYEQAFEQIDPLMMGETQKDIDRLTGKNRDWKAGLTTEESAEAHRLLNQAGEVLGLLRKGGERPKCEFTEDYDWIDGGPLMARLRRSQAGARLLVFSSRVNLAEGKPDAAVADCVQAMKLTRSLDSAPTLISELVGVACESMAMKQLAAVLDGSEPSADALREMGTAIGDPEDRARFVRAMRGERRAGLEMCMSMIGGPGARPALPGRPAANWLERPVAVGYVLSYLDMMDSAVELAGSSRWAPDSNWSRADAELRRIGSDRSWQNVIAGFMAPALTAATQVFDQCVARKGNAKLAIALRLYRMKNGNYPAALDALVPEFLAKVPADPFSGKPFIYRREGNGFIVYSVSVNGKDDGGVGDPKDRDDGDIVWKCSR